MIKILFVCEHNSARSQTKYKILDFIAEYDNKGLSIFVEQAQA